MQSSTTEDTRKAEPHMPLTQPLWKTVKQFLRKLNTHLLSHLASIVLDMYLRYMEAYTDIKTYPEMLTVALFIIVINWKLAKCSSRCEWLNKPWYIHVMEYYPEIKRNRETTDMYNGLCGSPRHCVEWKKKPILKDHMLYDLSSLIIKMTKL